MDSRNWQQRFLFLFFFSKECAELCGRERVSASFSFTLFYIEENYDSPKSSIASFAPARRGAAVIQLEVQLPPWNVKEKNELIPRRKRIECFFPRLLDVVVNVPKH